LQVNRLVVPPELLYDSQSRADLIGAAAISGFVLNSLSALEVTSREAEPVELDGTCGRGVSRSLLPEGALAGAQPAVAWAVEALLEHTPADTVRLRGRKPFISFLISCEHTGRKNDCSLLCSLQIFAYFSSHCLAAAPNQCIRHA